MSVRKSVVPLVNLAQRCCINDHELIVGWDNGKCKVFHGSVTIGGALVAQSSGQAPFTSEFVGSNLGSDATLM